VHERVCTSVGSVCARACVHGRGERVRTSVCARAWRACARACAHERVRTSAHCTSVGVGVHERGGIGCGGGRHTLRYPSTSLLPGEARPPLVPAARGCVHLPRKRLPHPPQLCRRQRVRLHQRLPVPHGAQPGRRRPTRAPRQCALRCPQVARKADGWPCSRGHWASTAQHSRLPTRTTKDSENQNQNQNPEAKPRAQAAPSDDTDFECPRHRPRLCHLTRVPDERRRERLRGQRLSVFPRRRHLECPTLPPPWRASRMGAPRPTAPPLCVWGTRAATPTWSLPPSPVRNAMQGGALPALPPCPTACEKPRAAQSLNVHHHRE
jgi:hypothetical protein